MSKFILLRPDSGLNDIFFAIESYAGYAEQTDRILIVDTAYRNSKHFNEELGRYFRSRSIRLILSAGEHYEFLSKLSVFPNFLQNRIHDYESFWSTPQRNYCDRSSNSLINFDLTKNYSESLLVAHTASGGQNSFFTCARLRVNDIVRQQIKSKLEFIGGYYDAIHVRHTDYQTNYHEKLIELKQAGVEKLFVATDNEQVVQDFKNELGENRVYSFANLKRHDGLPLHRNEVRDQLNTTKNLDAIVDLLLLALARNLHILPITGPGGAKYSGFSLLAKNLWTSKVMLKRFLS
jgi:hypothetical protein